MISSVEITQFRGIREGKLEDLTPLTILVGPNGCGKSSVLDALLIAADPNSQQALAQVQARHPGVQQNQRWFLWKGDKAQTATITIVADAGSSRTMDISAPGPLVCTVRPLAEISAAGGVFGRPAVPELVGVSEIRLVEPHVFQTQPALHRLYSTAVERGRKDEAKEMVTAVVPGTKDLEILTEGDLPIVHLVFKDHSVPIAFAGDGVYSLVRLCFELACRREGVVLLEEPETHQHPGAIRQTVKAILAAVRREIQVILTTHSLELIDMLLSEATDEDLEMMSVQRLSLQEGVLKSRLMPGTEVAFLRTEIENDLR